MSLLVLLITWVAATGLVASEYQGTIKAGGLPLAGATVTAGHGENKTATTTDERGVFRFAELADGNWTIEVQMVGFENLRREVGIAPGTPAGRCARGSARGSNTWRGSPPGSERCPPEDRPDAGTPATSCRRAS